MRTFQSVNDKRNFLIATPVNKQEKMHIPDKAKLLFGLSIVCVSLAASEYYNPATPRPNGRYSWIFAPIFDNFGVKGLVFYWLAIAILLALIAILNIRRNK